jgi:hypothetical protein
MKKKVLFQTNDNKYPFVFLQNDGTYHIIKVNGTLTGDVFDSKEEVLIHFPKADLESL